MRQVDIRWLLPATFILHFTYPNGLVHAICGFATPIDVHRCRRILESGPADYPLDPRAEAHMLLDRPSLMMRQALRELLRSHDPNAHMAAHELGSGDTPRVDAA